MIESAAAANIGSIMGIGFPAMTGGAAQYMTGYENADGQIGLGAFVARADELAEKYGDRFDATPYLRDLAASGGSFPAVAAALAVGRCCLVRHGQASFGTDDYDVRRPRPAGSRAGLLGGWLAVSAVGDARPLVDARRVCDGTARPRRRSSRPPAGPSPSIDRRWDEFDHLSVVAAVPDATTVDVSTGATSSGSSSARPHDGPAAATTAEYVESCVGLPRPGRRRSSEAACALTGAGTHGRGGRPPVARSPPCVRASSTRRPTCAAYARLWSRFNTVLVNSSVTRVVVGSTGPGC